MEPKQESKVVRSKPISTTSIRVKKETRKKVLYELAKANRKDFGRKLRTDDLIALAMTLLQPEHIVQLQEGTLSNADRLEKKFKEHVAKHGSMSKDAFIGKLLKADLNTEKGEQLLTP